MTVSPRALLLGIAGLIPVLLWPSALTVALTALGCALVVVGDAVAAPSVSRLRFTRRGPGRARLGETATATLLVTNASGRPVQLRVRDAWVPSAGLTPVHARLSVPARERRAIRQEFVPARRGDLAARALTVRVRGPLGMAARQRTFTVPGTLRVLPEFRSRRSLPSRVRRLRQLEGSAVSMVRGQGTEFDSLRSYVDGDDVRSIDWRATARRREVVVRTWRPERDRSVVLVLDTSRTAAARIGDGTRLDAAMDTALLLGALASTGGDKVDLLCCDRILHASVTGASRSAVLHEMITTLAPIEPALVETNWETVAHEIDRRGYRDALVVLLTTAQPQVLDAGLLPVLRRIGRRNHVLIASVADPSLATLAGDRSDADAVYRAVAAEREAAARAALSGVLESLGADLVEAEPDDLPTALADRFIALKASGRL